jgi:hypothetical protein
LAENRADSLAIKMMSGSTGSSAMASGLPSNVNDPTVAPVALARTVAVGVSSGDVPIATVYAPSAVSARAVTVGVSTVAVPVRTKDVEPKLSLEKGSESVRDPAT